MSKSNLISPGNKYILSLFITLFALLMISTSHAQLTVGDLVASTAAGSEEIVILDTTNAAVLDTLLNLSSVTEIEFREDGTLFATTGGGNSAIFRWSPGDELDYPVMHSFGAINGLEFDNEGNLYGTYIPGPGLPSMLIKINTYTGDAVVVGSTGLRNIGGLAFAQNGTLYGTTTGPIGGGDLVTLNTTTGEATLVGTTGFNQVSALEFSPGGVLYAGVGSNEQVDSLNGNIITIDPLTGAGTLVGPTGYEAISGLSYYPPPLTGPQLYASAGTVDFYEVFVGETSPSKTIAIESIGDSNLTITNIAIGDTLFKIINPPELPVILEPGETLPLEIVFTAIDTLPKSSTITISSNDPDTPSKNIALSGLGFKLHPAQFGTLLSYSATQGLLELDPNSGQYNLIGKEKLSNNELYSGAQLAISPQGEIFSVSNEQIFQIDALSGGSVYVLEKNYLQSLTFDSNGTAYASVDDEGYYIIWIDLETGEDSTVSNDIDNLDGIAINPVDNSLWGFNYEEIYYFGSITDSIIDIPISVFELDYELTAISFDAAGNLYAIGYDEFGSILLNIDIQTGSTTPINSIDQFLTGLAFHNRPIPGRHIHTAFLNNNFGFTKVGESDTMRIKISNIGTESLTITDINLPNAPFSLIDLPSTPVYLPSINSITLLATFTPQGQGLMDGAFTISSDDSNNPVYNISLTGQGFDFNPAQPNVLYTIINDQNGTSSLFTVNPNDAQGTKVGETGKQYMRGLAINSKGEIFSCNEDDTYLYKIDALTGIADTVGDTELEGLQSLAFYYNDMLIIYDNHNEEFFVINPLTAEAITSTPGRNFRGLTFNPEDSSFWGATSTEIYSIEDTVTSDSLIGEVENDPLRGLQFNARGDLFAISGEWEEYGAYLLSVNTETGEDSLIGEITDDSQASGLAYYNVFAGPQKISADSTFDFGTIKIGDTSFVSIVISNSGGYDLILSDISTSAPFHIVETPTLPASIGYTQSVSFDVMFVPTDTTEANGTLTLTSNAVEEPVLNIALHGEVAIVNSIANLENGLPKEFALRQNYPNPFNPTTTIRYDLPKDSKVEIIVYNIMGQKVTSLVNRYQAAGRYSLIWNANSLSSGMYYYKITAGNYQQIRKSILIK